MAYIFSKIMEFLFVIIASIMLVVVMFFGGIHDGIIFKNSEMTYEQYQAQIIQLSSQNNYEYSFEEKGNNLLKANIELSDTNTIDIEIDMSGDNYNQVVINNYIDTNSYSDIRENINYSFLVELSNSLCHEQIKEKQLIECINQESMSTDEDDNCIIHIDDVIGGMLDSVGLWYTVDKSYDECVYLQGTGK